MKKPDPNLPVLTNILLVIGIQVLILFLLYLASNLALIWALPIGIIISFVLLTNYALMHEGAHHNLHPSKRANRLLGSLSAGFFPVSFTFFSIAHQIHHDHNRTDHEMFDYYYPEDNLAVKYAQWYSILLGIYPPIIPFGSIIMGFAPWIFLSKPFAKARSSSVLFANDKFSRKDISKIRVEVIFIAIYWLIVWNLLALSWLPMLIIYACFCFNWSTRQYVTHAFTPRAVIEGALNLKVSKPFGWILLNGQWDQVHHKHPGLSWANLPHYASSTMRPVSYWRQYVRLWKGPRPNKEPAPKALKT